jgi:hypothetical protein
MPDGIRVLVSYAIYAALLKLGAGNFSLCRVGPVMGRPVARNGHAFKSEGRVLLAISLV